MAKIYTTDELVTEVKMLASVSNSSTTYDAAILSHLNAVLQTVIVPELINAQEEYLVCTNRYDLSIFKTQLGTPLNVFKLPPRTYGNKLRDIYYVDSYLEGSRTKLEQIDRNELYNQSPTDTVPTSFYMEGDYIKLWPGLKTLPAFGSHLEISYYQRPAEMVLTTNARKVTVVDTTTRKITIASAAPTAWTTSTQLDVHSEFSGASLKFGGYAPITFDADRDTLGFAIPIDGTISYFTSGPYSNVWPVEVGDWMCAVEECVVPPIPKELHQVLVRGACLRLAESLGNIQQVQIHGGLLQQDLARITKSYRNRVESKSMILSGNTAMLWE